MRTSVWKEDAETSSPLRVIEELALPYEYEYEDDFPDDDGGDATFSFHHAMIDDGVHSEVGLEGEALNAEDDCYPPLDGCDNGRADERQYCRAEFVNQSFRCG